MGNAVRRRRSKKYRSSEESNVQVTMPVEPAAEENCSFTVEMKKQLRERLDTDFGLLEDLRAVLTDEQYERMYAFRNLERNEKLLDIINNIQYGRFMKGLGATNQLHVFNMIKQVYGAIVDDDYCLPLTDEQRTIIETNMHQLVEIIDMREFLPIVFGIGSISHPQYDYITVECLPEREKNMRMWEILLKRSQRDFENVRVAFERTGQRHIATVLSRGGAILPIRAYLDGESKVDAGKVMETELKDWNDHATVEERRLLTAAFEEKSCSDVELIAVRKHSSSVVFYIHCVTERSIRCLVQIDRKRQLIPLFDAVVAFILNRHEVKIQSIELDHTDTDRCFKYFRKINELRRRLLLQNDAGSRQKWDEFKLLWSRIPVEVLELLLQRASVVLFKKLLSSQTRDADIVAISTLNAVCRQWWQVLTTRPLLRRQIRQFFIASYRPLRRPVCLEGSLDVTEASGNKLHNAVAGVAVLSDKLFVISEGVSAITVFDLSSLTVCQRIAIDKLRGPTDIASCNASHRLYIADCVGKKVWHVDWPPSIEPPRPMPATVVVGRKFAKTDYFPWSVSVTNQQLLVTSHHSKSLYLYDTDGKCLQCIGPLTTRAFPPMHALQTTDKTYIVCHAPQQLQHQAQRQRQPQDSVPCLSEIVEYDGRGRQLRTSGRDDENCAQLCCAHHLFLDIDSKYMFVADSCKRSVLLFTSELQFQGVVLSLDSGKQNAITPQRLWYIQSTRQLFVGLSHGCVDVYCVCF